MSDTLRIVILDDGTIRTETDRVSAPNHASAEQFLATVSLLTGGNASRQRKDHIHHVHHNRATQE